MSTLHEQARAEAEKRYPVSVGVRVLHGDRQTTFIEGYVAGHEAATRTRVVTTVTELDALPVGSVVLDAGSYVMHKVWGIPEPVDHWSYLGTEHPAVPDLPARVLYDPEEEQAATATAADPAAYRPVERFGAEGGRLLPARTGSVDTHTDTPEEDT